MSFRKEESSSDNYKGSPVGLLGGKGGGGKKKGRCEGEYPEGQKKAGAGIGSGVLATNREEKNGLRPFPGKRGAGVQPTKGVSPKKPPPPPNHGREFCSGGRTAAGNLAGAMGVGNSGVGKKRAKGGYGVKEWENAMSSSRKKKESAPGKKKRQ